MVPRDVAVMEIRSAGYGMQVVFSDNHARGIFPWIYVAALSDPAPGSTWLGTASGHQRRRGA